MQTIQTTNASSIQIFNSPLFGEIRISEIDGDPIFLANDLAKALGYSNPRKAIGDHCDNEDVTKRDTPTDSGSQLMTYVNESGMYSLILRSKLPQAKEFKRWVTSEVLPSIRKSGGYIETQQEDTPEMIMARALQVAQQTIDTHKQRVQQLEGENEHLTQENHVLAPKAAYTDEVLQSISTFTLTQVAHSLGLRSVHVLTDQLAKRGLLFRQSGQWQPTAKVAERGYFTTRTSKYIKSDNSIGTSLSTVVTEAGRQFLHSIIANA